MSQLKDFMGNDLKPGSLYTYTHYYSGGGFTQVLVCFDKHAKSRAIFRHLTNCFDNNVLHLNNSSTSNTCYLISRALIRVTPDMLPDNINLAIKDWFYRYTEDNNLTDFSNEWWPKT